MINKICSAVFQIIIFITITSCNSKTNKGQEIDHITYGNTKMLVDESLFPIVDDEYEIFKNNYPEASIDLVYKPQTELLKLFLNDSIPIAIMPRKLTKQEERFYTDRNVVVRSTKFATDGIALITGSSNQDTLLTTDRLKKILTGSGADNKQVIVFDNQKSSTVEYLMQYCGVNKFPSNIYALDSNKDVIKYVIDHPNSIGILSVSWLKRPTKDLTDLVEKLNIIALQQPDGTYQKPTQSNLKTRNYPLLRDLYLVDCQGRAGLGTGFASFLASEIGQRIILKSGLAPDSLPSRQIHSRN